MANFVLARRIFCIHNPISVQSRFFLMPHFFSVPFKQLFPAWERNLDSHENVDYCFFSIQFRDTELRNGLHCLFVLITTISSFIRPLTKWHVMLQYI